MNKNKSVKTSKLLSYVLRHRADEFDLTLNDAGWASVDDLLSKLNQHGKDISLADLIYVVDTNSKKRFEFNEDGSKVRASQGHSMKVDLGYSPTEPPDILYHGTATRFLDSIREKGLLKGDRHHVHLLADNKSVLDVGQRHGKPVRLDIDASQMLADGYKFFLSSNNVWLVDQVPPKYIKFPD